MVYMILLLITWAIGAIIACASIFFMFFKKDTDKRTRAKGFFGFVLGCGIIMLSPIIFDNQISDTSLIEKRTLYYDLQKLSGVNSFYQESKNDYVIKLSEEDLEELKEQSTKNEQYNYQVMQETYLKINKDTVSIKKDSKNKGKLIIRQEIYLKQYIIPLPDREETEVKYTIAE